MAAHWATWLLQCSSGRLRKSASSLSTPGRCCARMDRLCCSAMVYSWRSRPASTLLRVACRLMMCTSVLLSTWNSSDWPDRSGP